MENREYLNNLFDIYSELLTEIEQETFSNYYQEDLSLSEIAENRNISKSGVSKTLNGVLEKLTNYENKLHIFAKKQAILAVLSEKNFSEVKEKIINIIN